jgi:histidine racemase
MPKRKNMKERSVPTEEERNPSESRTFSVIRPGGNDTALFVGIPTEPGKKKQLNNAIMRVYPNIEQVGFVNLDPQHAELMMAGGEFCGNATRATAWKVLKGNPGDIEIKVSGVEKKLRAGVTQNGEAYAQMPVYADASLIKQDLRNPSNYTVEMEGITHYIDFNTDQIAGLTSEALKEKAFADMQARYLDEGPAAGIIYTEKSEDGYKITPVVYVRDIDTLFVETACGSGTAALGLALAKQKGESICEVPIVQPSGLPIKISVNYDNERVGYTQIQGPIQKLNEGSLEVKGSEAYAVEEVRDEKQLDNSLTKGNLNNLYRECFGGPPYYEQFSDEEIKAIFSEYVRDGRLFIARDKGDIVGFGASLPLSSVSEIDSIIAKTSNIDRSNCWYMADLGVKPEYRSNGIARKMVAERIAAAPEDATILMRTSINNIASQTLYRSQGFQQIEGAYQDVERTRTDGQVISDKRLFLAKKKK